MTRKQYSKRLAKKFPIRLPHLPIPVLILLTMGFVGFGDRVLPKPLSTWSYQSRTAINDAMLNAFPSWQPKTKPHQRTEETLDKELEKLNEGQ